MTATKGATAAVAAILAANSAPAISGVLRITRPPLGIRDELDDRGCVGLSFDDGPHHLATPAVLDLLDKREARATFFLVGEQVLRHPGLAAEIAAAGHEIALHCHRHRFLPRLSPRQAIEDLRRAEDAIIDTTGRVPRAYRPPHGFPTAAALLYARRRGWHTTLWTRAGSDWRSQATAASITAELTAGLCGGEILLLHDADHYSSPLSWQATVEALPLVFDRLDEQGLQAVALDHPFTVDSGGA